jgi:hypothetical protein
MRTYCTLILLGLWTIVFAQPDVLPVVRDASRSVQQAMATEGSLRNQHLREAVQKLNKIPQPVRKPLIESLKEVQTLTNTKEQANELRKVLRQLDAHREVIEWRSSTLLDAAQTAKQLEVIYASPDMQPPTKTLIQRFFEWIGQRLEALFDALGKLFGRPRVGAAPSWFAQYAQFIVIGALILLAALGGAYVLNRVEWKRNRRAKTEVDVETIEDARLLTGDEWRQTALQLAAQGEHRLAIRAIYLGMLRTMDQNGWLHYDPTLTNWEHLAKLRTGAHSNLYERMSPITMRFDRIWYGERSAGESDFRPFLDIYDLLVKQGIKPAQS